jgi:predicted nucleic acid-binding Zn ribbon protein
VKAKRKAPRIPRAFEVMPAASAIGRALALHGLSDEIRAGRLLTEWAELVGAKIAQRTRPDGIHERTLWIEVATSAWMHELNLLRAQLVQGLLERLGEPRLFEDVKFRLAGRHRRPPIALRAPRRPPPPAKPLPMPATGAAREAIVRDVASVDDAELRELIARIRITHDK